MDSRQIWVVCVLFLTGCSAQPEFAVDVPFTITGLAQAADGTWWAGNHGKAHDSDPEYHPSLVHLSKAFKVIGEIPLAERYPGIKSVQGVAVDGDSLWFADLEGRAVRHISIDGKPLGEIRLPYKPNGIAKVGDTLWINDFDSDRLEHRTCHGELLQTATVRVGRMRDQLSAAGNLVLYSYGPNRSPGKVGVYDSSLHPVRTLTLSGADSIEGIVLVGDTLYVANDGQYHHASPPRNRVLAYKFP